MLDKTIKIYKCDQCGKRETWNENWIWKWEPRGKGGAAAFEETITVCSKECKIKYDNARLGKGRKVKPHRSGGGLPV